MKHFKTSRRRLLAAACGAAIAAASGTAWAAQDAYPARPIRMVVPFGPGSVTDLLARIVAKQLTDGLGQTVIVENKAGAGGNIGAAEVATSAPDGYTLLVGPTSTNAIAPSLYKDLRFNPLKDFVPITNLATVANVLVVPPAVPARSTAEFISLAGKQNLSYASTGNGGSMHLSGELFKSMSHTSMVHVPYRGGGAALADLLPGRVDAMFCNLPLCLPHIQSGKLVALGVTSARRSSLLPDVPTIGESALPGYEVDGWFGLFAPAGTPPAIVQRLNTEVVRILDMPDIKAQLLAQGAEPAGGSAADFARFVQAEHDKWARVIQQAGIKAE